MKKKQLQELIRHITRSVLKEFSSMSSSTLSSSNSSKPDPNQDPNSPPVEAMTTAEKAKAARDARLKAAKDITQNKAQFETDKKEAEFHKSKVKSYDRYTRRDDMDKINASKKELQTANKI